MKQVCIMKEFDFITPKTLDMLTKEQYNLFRDYLKICGLRVFRVMDEYGISTYAKKYGVYLDGGDLVVIYPTMIDKLKNEITLMQILQTINTMTTVQAPNTHDIQQIDCLIAHHQTVIEELTRKRIEMEMRDDKYSLGQAFLVIGNAITNPNTNIPIIDHRNTKHDHLVLAESIISLIEKLGLKNFHVNKSKLVIRYCVPH